MNYEDEYNLVELIELLEKIKHQGDGVLNFPKALYCLAKELEKIKLEF